MHSGWPWTELPRFHRVRKLRIRTVLGKKYITCSCGFHERVGTPCRHIFCALDGAVDITMMNVRWWKAFHKHFGESSRIGMFDIICNVAILEMFINKSYSHLNVMMLRRVTL